MRRYTLINTHRSSAVFGPCEVCKMDTSEVFHQIEERQYISPIDNQPHWTTANCHDLFGCKKCLTSKQKMNKQRLDLGFVIYKALSIHSRINLKAYWLQSGMIEHYIKQGHTARAAWWNLIEEVLYNPDLYYIQSPFAFGWGKTIK